MKSCRREYILHMVLGILFAAVLGAAAILFAALYRYDSKTGDDGVLYPIAIEGEYSEEGESGAA